MGVYELSGAGSLKTGRTMYTSMNAGNMYGAMVPIASRDLTGTALISITNIPQIYQDLRVVLNARLGTGETISGFFGFTLDDTSSVYSTTVMDGNGSSAVSSRSTNSGNGISYQYMGSGTTSGIVAANTIDFFNYSSTSTFKTAITRSAADYNSGGLTRLFTTLYRSVGAITRMDISSAGYTWGAGSTFTLYGIKASNS